LIGGLLNNWAQGDKMSRDIKVLKQGHCFIAQSDKGNDQWYPETKYLVINDSTCSKGTHFHQFFYYDTPEKAIEMAYHIPHNDWFITEVKIYKREGKQC
jgi:hypothetical protein